MEKLSLKEKIDSGIAKEYTLSIRLMPDGFSFSIHNFLLENSFCYESHIFPAGKCFLSALEESILRNEQLLLPFGKINVLVASNRFTLVPEPFYADSEKEKLFDFNLNRAHEVILTNRMKQTGAVNIYGIEKDVYAFLLRTFHNPNFFHHISVLTEYFAGRSKLGNSAKMICQYRPGMIDIICFRKGKLLLANSFKALHPNDATYFILNCWKNSGLDAEGDTLQITGDQKLCQEVSSLLTPYLAHIEPIVFPTQIFTMGKESIKSPFDLIALDICGL
ncbi:MAG: DUF3822 family protein [Bacteroidales bacterium]